MSLKTMNHSSDYDEEIKRPLALSIRHLTYRPRTVYEMQKFIREKGFDEDIVKTIIEILLEKKYLDDKAFANLFVESKIKYKAKSKFAFRYELKKKGISPSIIDSILEHYDDQDLALKAVDKKIKAWQNLDDEKFKRKLMNFLQYRGFTYNISISTLNHFMEIKDGIKEN